ANLKRRRLVRAVLALDRYGQPLRRAIAERRRRLRMRLNQVELLTGAARNQGQLPERRATVAAAIERLAPARREPRRRSIVVVTDHPVVPALGTKVHDDDEVVVVAPQPLDETGLASSLVIISPAPECASAAAPSGATAARRE